MKLALTAIFGLVALGAWAMGFSAASDLNKEVKPQPLPKLVMRALPPLGKPVTLARNETPPAPAAAPEPVKEVEAPKPAPPAPKEEAPAPAPTPKPKPAARAQPSEDEPPPLPRAKPPPPAPREPKEPKEEAAPPAAAPGGEGVANFKASDTAEVVLDGRKIGPSPKLNVKLKAGKHKVRFDCYDENGNLRPGKVQQLNVTADGEYNVDYDCPTGG
jgi:outer membrane biosynthesis protein TonB